MRLLIVLVLIAGCTSAIFSGDNPRPAIRVETGDVPIGTLGVSIGQLVLLEGSRIDGVKTGVSTLKIDKIDGRVPKSPLYIRIDNVDLPKDTPCVLRGYETMHMIGEPPAYEEFARLKKQPSPALPQAGWQVSCTFVALEAVEPKSLKVRDPGT
jgi:hypothetical protein